MGWLVIAVIVFLIWRWNRVPTTPIVPPVRSAPPSMSQPQPLSPLVEDPRDVEFSIIKIVYEDGICAVCRSNRRARFQTPRVRLCQWCVSTLKGGAPFDILAMERVIWRSRTAAPEPRAFLHDVLNRYMLNEVISRRMSTLFLQNEKKSHNKDWLLAMRAYHLGLISRDVRLPRPPDDVWSAMASGVRRQDGMHCRVCERSNMALHVHHMIPLSDYGANDPSNLVTLCHRCHLAQHPGVLFSRDAPEDEQQGDSDESGT